MNFSNGKLPTIITTRQDTLSNGKKITYITSDFDTNKSIKNIVPSHIENSIDNIEYLKESINFK